jgi:hypothetical protein
MQELKEDFETKLGDISDKFDMAHLLDNFIQDLYVSNKEVLNDDVINSSVYANTMMFTNIIAILIENNQTEAAYTICANTHYFIILNSIMIDIKSLEGEDNIENSRMFFKYAEFIFDFLDKNMI